MSAELDLEELRILLRRVGHERIDGLAREVDRTQQFSPELWSLLCSLGIPSLPFPEALGGVGGSYRAYVVGIEEIATAGAVAALYSGPTVQVASAVVRFGTEAQIAKWGDGLIQGKKLGAWAFTEPATGSDPRQITTTARRDGEEWILNGAKMFISFAPYADVALVFAKTSDTKLGAFLVDTSAHGWQPGKPIEMLAMGGQGTSAVTIDNLRVSADSLLGQADGGFDIMVGTEAEAKIRAGAICVGIGRRALDESVRYASERHHRDVPIGQKFPTIQALIGEMSASVDGARAMVHRGAAAVDSNDPDVKRIAASVRIVCSRMAREVTSNAMQICGAYGFTREMVLERLYREGKFYEVGQGAIELQRIIVGKARLKEFGERGTLHAT